MPHGAVDMDGNAPLQPTQETVPGRRKCKYQLLLFLVCLFICFGFYERSGEPQVVICARSWKGKRYFICPQHEKIELAFYLKGQYHELLVSVSIRLIFHTCKNICF